MREAIGGTWLFQIVIVFILLFAGYMCLSINHSKAFSIKSEIIESLSRNGGVNEDEISDILSKASYRTSGDCRKFNEKDADAWYGYDRNGKSVDNATATFCIRKIDARDKGDGLADELPDMYYYQVRVFYQLDLPVFNSLFSFTVKGDTTLLYNHDKGVDNNA